MKQRFKLYRRNNGRYYAEDTITGKQSSLGTSEKAEANRLLHAQNEAAYQPTFNNQITKTYLATSDQHVETRTSQKVMDKILQSNEVLCEKTRTRT